MARWLAPAVLLPFIPRRLDRLALIASAGSCRGTLWKCGSTTQHLGWGARSSSRAWDWTDVVHWTHLAVLIAGALAAGGVILLTLFAGVDALGQASQTLSRQAPLPDHVAVDIMPVKPGGAATRP